MVDVLRAAIAELVKACADADLLDLIVRLLATYEKEMIA